ncbi:hypothetical protein [Legionella tunisiensis]|uniref:hypothetical protein n=1 Tax=Legionella tunisiensis TaxID=1034944 RepID=UPI0002FF7B6D|nr:hypothetical protein [Legionella tunisiensis]
MPTSGGISTRFKTASKRGLGVFKPEKLEDLVAQYYRRIAPGAVNHRAMERLSSNHCGLRWAV